MIILIRGTAGIIIIRGIELKYVDHTRALLNFNTRLYKTCCILVGEKNRFKNSLGHACPIRALM